MIQIGQNFYALPSYILTRNSNYFHLFKTRIRNSKYLDLLILEIFYGKNCVIFTGLCPFFERLP